MPDSPVAVGDVLGGKYRVERVLGQGGMGVVVAATNTLIDQRVALKFLLPQAVTGTDTVQRFIREAKAAARIQSEHVVRVLDVGTLDDGLPYMVMEYLDGQDLSDLLATRGVLALDEAVGYVLQACEALAEAHALGIIHRDIKPSNIFLAKRTTGMPSVKLLDFGISKVAPVTEASREAAALTRTNATMGSPLYMSPEQMTNAKNVDARADIWSLGVTLHELLAGRPPFFADTMPELIASILQTTPQSIRSVRAELPNAFETALSRCLAKDRAQRFSNVAELAAALAPFGPKYAQLSLERISNVLAASSSSTSSKAASVAPPPIAIGEAATQRQVGTVSGAVWGDVPAGVPKTIRPKTVWALVGVVAVVVSVVGGRAWITRRTSTETTPSTASKPTAVGETVTAANAVVSTVTQTPTETASPVAAHTTRAGIGHAAAVASSSKPPTPTATVTATTQTATTVSSVSSSGTGIPMMGVK
jgi:serine/threonine-protein kinase